MRNHICQCRIITYCSIIFFISSVVSAFAQFDSLGLNTKWSKGSIVLTDNSSLKGQIRFNDKMGIVKFKKKADDVEESFTETSIAVMQFYDEDAGRMRNFATFSIKEEETGWRGDVLLEVLMEFEKFALLSRIERVNVSTRERRDTYGVSYTEKVGYEQFEKFCIVDDKGTGVVVLAVSEFERNKLSIASKLKPYINKAALEKHLAGDWKMFESIVKSNRLNLKKRADFLVAFETYQLEVKRRG